MVELRARQVRLFVNKNSPDTPILGYSSPRHIDRKPRGQMSLLLLLFAAGLAAVVSGKTYERCELARELKYVHEVPDDELATWVCIAEHESQYNTSAIGSLSGDGSGDHGLFQINDEYWCSPPGKGWACGLSCAQLEDDDIEDDYECARRIHKEHKLLSGDGFNAWTVYHQHCKGSRVEKYIEDCFTEQDELTTLRPKKKKKVTKKIYPWEKPRTTPSQSTELPPCAHQTNVIEPETNIKIDKKLVTVALQRQSIVPGFISSTFSTQNTPSPTVHSTTPNLLTGNLVSTSPRVSSTSNLPFGSLSFTNQRITPVSLISSTATPIRTTYQFPSTNRFSPTHATSHITYSAPTAAVIDGTSQFQNIQKRESVFIFNGRPWP